MDDGILERLGVCFGEAGLGGLDGGDAALEDVGGTVDAVLLAHGIRAALISILLTVQDALRNTDGDGLDGLNALGGGDGHGAANADGQTLRALFLALEGQNIAEASDITEALAKGACLVVEGGGFILALRGEEDAGELAVELVFELFLDTDGAVLHVVVVNDENIVLGMTAFVLCVSHNELVADFVLEADVGELAVAAGILTGQALVAGVAVGVCTVDGDKLSAIESRNCILFVANLPQLNDSCVKQDIPITGPVQSLDPVRPPSAEEEEAFFIQCPSVLLGHDRSQPVNSTPKICVPTRYVVVTHPA